MGFLEASVPKQYRKKFVDAVAAQRVMNRKGKSASIEEANRYYKAINALPLHWQLIAKKRA
jgi:hypothetical protein